MDFQLTNQGSQSLGRLFNNMATLPARAKLLEQQTRAKALLDQATLDNRQASAEYERARTARANREMELINQAIDTFAKNPNTANFLALQGGGKQYLPYRQVGNTGFSINEATGAQNLTNPTLANIYAIDKLGTGTGGSGAGGGVSGRELSPSQIRESFVKFVNGTDIYGEPQLVKTFDEKGYQDYITQSAKYPNYRHTISNLTRYLGGVTPWAPETPTAPVASSPVARTFAGVESMTQPTQSGNIDLSNRPIVQNLHEQQAEYAKQAMPLATRPIEQTFKPREKAIAEIHRMYRAGELSREDAKIALNTLGLE